VSSPGGSSFRLAVKDNIDVAGLPTTAGLQAWRNRIAQLDAPVVASLKKSGAIVTGKTLMDEAAFGALGDNPWYGRVHNPARHGYTCGGSSAGSAAAVASGEADLALGTDTLGSVRIPASYCGVVGYVPSAGRIDMTGVTPLAPSFDRLGLFTRTLPEMVRFAGMLFDHGKPASKTPSVGVLTNHPHCARAAERLRRAGCRVTPIKAFDLGALRRAMLLQIEAEAAPALLALPSLSEPLRAALEFGGNATPERLERAESTCAAARRTIREWLRNDLLLLPSTPQSAFPFDGPVPPDQADYATLSSLLRLPAISVPAPVGPGELPIGVQLVAPAGKDASLLTTAALLA
jgi:Asp-tRNA(Asn)/Glu-tRNA(Gln) amidotransferase A subunit family amidase